MSIQGTVSVTITTACFPSSIEIYENRLFSLATFILWFFFKKVSFNLKSKNCEKPNKLLASFSHPQTSLLAFTQVSLSLKENCHIWN